MARTPLFVFSADLHLKKNLIARFPEAQGDTLFGLRQVVDLANRHEVPLVLGGDIFDRPVLNSEVFVGARRVLESARHPVHVTMGNHDRAYPKWSSALPVRDLAHQEDSPTEFRGVWVQGIDCLDSQEVESAYTRVASNIDVLVGHQSLADLYPMDHSYRLESAWVPDSVSLALLGHIHAPDVYPLLGGAQPPRIVYSGSTAVLSIAEPKEKSCVLVYDDLSWERVPIRVRAYHDYLIHCDSDVAKLAEGVAQGALEPDKELPPEVQKPFMRLTYDSRNVGAARLRELVGDRAYLRLLPLAIADSADTDTGAGNISLDELVRQFVKPQQDPMLYNFVYELARDRAAGPALEQLRVKLDVDPSANLAQAVSV